MDTSEDLSIHIEGFKLFIWEVFLFSAPTQRNHFGKHLKIPGNSSHLLNVILNLQSEDLWIKCFIAWNIQLQLSHEFTPPFWLEITAGATKLTSPRFKRVWSMAPPTTHSPFPSSTTIINLFPGYNTFDKQSLLSPAGPLWQRDETLCNVHHSFCCTASSLSWSKFCNTNETPLVCLSPFLKLIFE